MPVSVSTAPPLPPSSPGRSPDFDRGKPVALPLVATEPEVKSVDLQEAATQVADSARRRRSA